MTTPRISFLAAGALLSGWIALGLLKPPSGDLRSFDAQEVGAIEADMWRSYYERRPGALFLQLGHLLRTQYGQTYPRSLVTAYHAAKAAFIFKDGKDRAGYERALPDLRAYYSAILPAAEDVNAVAALELEWWIIHRQRDRYSPDDLPDSLAALQSAIYHQPRERFATHARLRAEAMLMRDRLADGPGAPDSDWSRINEMLVASWASLAAAVR